LGEGFSAAVRTDRELGLSAFREQEFGEKQTQGTASFLMALGFLVAGLFALGATLGAMITMHAAIAQRTREIGTLRALGFSRRHVLLSFVFEAVVLALAGGVLGALASLALAMKRISMINTATWAELSFQFEPSAGILLSALAVAALMGLAGGLAPAWAATRVDAARAMRGGA
jgi:putative ABC transport system permease protein